MRTADGFTDAVTGAVALARGDLGPAAAHPGLVGADYFSADAAGTPPHPTRGTSGQWHNMIVEEFQYVLDIGSLAHPNGVTMDPTDNAQVASVVQGAGAIFAPLYPATTTGYVSTPRRQAVIAVENCRASGDNSIVGASFGDGDGLISGGGDESFIFGCHADDVASASIGVTGIASGILCAKTTDGDITVAGANSLTAAALTGNAHLLQNGGDRCALLGVRADAAGAGILSGASQCAAIASIDPAIYGGCFEGFLLGTDTCVVATDSFYSGVVGSRYCTSAGTHGIVAGCEYVELGALGSHNAAIASRGATGHPTLITGTHSAMIGCSQSDGDMDGDQQVMLASGGTGFVDAPAASGQVFGGWNGVRTWRIDSQAGGFYASGTPSATAAMGGAAGTGQYNMSGADYSEFFCNLDGTAIPVGTLVTRRRQGVRPAKSGDLVLGVISGQPGILGNRVHGDEAHNPEEWACVALLGQIPVAVDESITQDAIDKAEADGGALYLQAGYDGDGQATRAYHATRIECMEMVGDNVCMCLIR